MKRILGVVAACLLTWVLPAVGVAAGKIGTAPRVFLTFDDGPINATLGILDVLQRHGVKATFFLNGNHLDGKGGEREDRAGEVLRRLVMEGHVIGNHGYDHMLHNNQPWRATRINVASFRSVADELPWFLPMNADPVSRVLGDLARTPNNRLASLGRLPYTNHWRLPGVAIDCPCCTGDVEGPPDTPGRCDAGKPGWSQSGINSAALADELYARGMRLFGWDLVWEPTDWDAADSNTTLLPPAELVRQIEAVLHGGRCDTRWFTPDGSCQTPLRQGKVIILTHDFLFENSFRGRGAEINLPRLEALVKALKKKGYRLDTLDHYL